MGSEDTVLMRRGDLIKRFGITDQLVTKLVDAGKLHPIHLTDGGRAHYRTSEIRALLKEQEETKK